MQSLFNLTVSFVIGLLTCLAMNQLFLQSKVARLVIDRPNHRSLHSAVIPRTGGLGIAFGLVFGLMCQQVLAPEISAGVTPTMAVYFLLLAVSLIDDVRPVSAKIRLAIHILLVIFWVQGQYSASWLLAGVFVLGMTWAMNLYNFMDGSDGLAGGLTLTAFLGYFVAAFAAHDLFLATISISVCGSVIGFLWFNWPPAKVFLGDAGSIPLGFLAAAVGATGVINGLWKPTFPLMLFAMFWIDATYTLARRAFRGEKVWQAHNEHWYQKAIRAGNSHRKVLLIHLACNTVIAGLALLSTLSPTFATPLVHILTIGAVIAIAFGFGVWAESQFRGFQAKQIK
jgi:UDP-N-acetylmuramyl pentapeptide phosphotransferase/UDP-N-acetylglucosamine-1-phosphate transferase